MVLGLFYLCFSAFPIRFEFLVLARVGIAIVIAIPMKWVSEIELRFHLPTVVLATLIY